MESNKSNNKTGGNSTVYVFVGIVLVALSAFLGFIIGGSSLNMNEPLQYSNNQFDTVSNQVETPVEAVDVACVENTACEEVEAEENEIEMQAKYAEEY